MSNQSAKYLPAAVVAIIIVIVAGVQYFKNQKPANETQNQNARQEQNQKNSAGGNPAAASGLEGVLKISDNLKRGNLMVVMAERVVYLFTSRDYSKLLNKEVKVVIDGTLENFRLVDIVAK